MLITFHDGTQAEGVLLSLAGPKMRVAVKGCDDVMEFTRIGEVWVSENCDPVRIQMEWERRSAKSPATEEDCICSSELAARLIRYLLNGDAAEAPDQLEIPGAIPECRDTAYVF